MKNGLLLLGWMLCFGAGHSQTDYWQQRLRYTLDVTLNDQDHTLDGFLKLNYVNHSPDTLAFIWFHLWPNAYKNDQTAFSEQLLENGRTDFYFSAPEERGYINRLDFRVNGSACRTEDHPQHIDILKVYLPQPLLPGDSSTLTTPFHVQLPKNFSRGGHVGRSYQITQWYPKPAVYDPQGWHPMPYLDQGEFYSEFGDYDIQITVPSPYVVAAAGTLETPEEKKWLSNRADRKLPGPAPLKKPVPTSVKTAKPAVPRSAAGVNTKTLRYQLSNAHDFAWFADTHYVVNRDTALLPSGKTVELYSFYTPAGATAWKQSIPMMKQSLRFLSAAVGEYPYPSLTAVEAPLGFSGGMEYPTITAISPQQSPRILEEIIQHEIGHNWFYGILANNERLHPWMDEGINTYYDHRYEKNKAGQKLRPGMQQLQQALIATLEQTRWDQPIATSAPVFTRWNYPSIAYYKAAAWMQSLEKYLGQPALDSAMSSYFREWQFRHPQPRDFLLALEKSSGKSLDTFQRQLNQSGPASDHSRKTWKPVFLMNTAPERNSKPITFLPVPGYNIYDGFQIGPGIHNLNLPPSPLSFFAAPQYATRSKTWNGLAYLNYRRYPANTFRQIDFSLIAERYSNQTGIDSNGRRISGHFSKIVPSVKWTLKPASLRSTREQWISYKLFLISEGDFNYVRTSSDSLFYPAKAATRSRYLNQLSFAWVDHRALYPFELYADLQQGQQFYRAQLTGHYFLNYAKGGGLNLRFFAAKFGYLGEKTFQKQLETLAFQPKLTAVRGTEDYTYSNYFFGRNEYSGWTSQQIMMRDGGLKLRTDLFQDLQGRSDNWIAAVNFNTTLPRNLLPAFLPLRIFFDAGTCAEAWNKNSTLPRFLYVGGLQLSLFKDLVNIYAPLFYSRLFSDNLKSVPEENRFIRKLSFSIDLQRFRIRRLTGNMLPF